MVLCSVTEGCCFLHRFVVRNICRDCLCWFTVEFIPGWLEKLFNGSERSFSFSKWLSATALFSASLFSFCPTTWGQYNHCKHAVKCTTRCSAQQLSQCLVLSTWECCRVLFPVYLQTVSHEINVRTLQNVSQCCFPPLPWRKGPVTPIRVCSGESYEQAKLG